MAVSMFATCLTGFIANAIIALKLADEEGIDPESYKKLLRGWTGWCVVDIVRQPLITISFWVGLYTFNIFATKPFEQSDRSTILTSHKSHESSE